MDRREFIKSAFGITTGLAVIPSISAKSVLRDIQKDRIFNGQVFEAPWPVCHTVIVQYFGRSDQWILLSSPYVTSQHKGSAMMVCYYKHDGSYNPIYTQKQLQEKLKDWKLVDIQRLELATGE